MGKDRAPARPNILVVMFDQLTPSALGCYGNPVTHAPTLDRLAREGVVFDAAYSNSPAVHTGPLLHDDRPAAVGDPRLRQRRVPRQHHPDVRAPRPRSAATARCSTARCTSSAPDQLHGFEERRTTDIYPADFGWTPDWLQPDERIDWWFHNMDSVTQARGRRGRPTSCCSTTRSATRACAPCTTWPATDDARPWLLVVSFTHPHDPYVTRGRYWDLYDGPRHPAARGHRRTTCRSTRTPRGCARSARWTRCEISPENVRDARRAYYGNISYLDEWTARLTGTLDALGVADDTVVVVLADHGDMLGERGLWYKMNFFEGSARIPMIVHAPKRFAPKRVAAPVSLVDVLPTITELVGGGAPERRRRAGRPVAARPVRGPAPRRPPSEREVIGEYLGEGAIAPIVMIRRGDLKYVHSPVDPDQLYDLAADPHERVNLAKDPDWSVRVKELRARVERRLGHGRPLRRRGRRPGAAQAGQRGAAHRHRHPWEYTPPHDGGRAVHAQPPRPQRGRAGEPLPAMGGFSPVASWMKRDAAAWVRIVETRPHRSRATAKSPLRRARRPAARRDVREDEDVVITETGGLRAQTHVFDRFRRSWLAGELGSSPIGTTLPTPLPSVRQPDPESCTKHAETMARPPRGRRRL